MYGTTHNRTLVKVKLKSTVQSSPGRRRSIRGEAQYLEFDLTQLLPSYYELKTWIDFSAARRVQVESLNVDVMGVWEVKEWLQERVFDAVGRRLQVGDQVKFEEDPQWFLLGERSHDEGIFQTVKMEKFNILRSDKP